MNLRLLAALILCTCAVESRAAITIDFDADHLCITGDVGDIVTVDIFAFNDMGADTIFTTTLGFNLAGSPDFTFTVNNSQDVSLPSIGSGVVVPANGSVLITSIDILIGPGATIGDSVALTGSWQGSTGTNFPSGPIGPGEFTPAKVLAAVAVPEPSTGLFAILGIAACSVRRRRV